ncbi:MAG: ATP-binding protein, partial [bacterium]|nr:ATP-binding protein [bacterium]
IPITDKDLFTAYIGQNGVGKSSILEGLDSFFNNRDWNINKQAKSGGGLVYINTPYIVPIFLIHKDKLPQKTVTDKINYALVENLSSYFWNIKRGEISSSTIEVTNFINFRDNLNKKYSQEDYKLLLLGKRFEQQNKIYFGSFHHQNSFFEKCEIQIGKKTDSKQENYLIEDKAIQSKYFGVLDYISELYSYIYIPSDIDVSDYTRLETLDMQKLMDKNIKTTISTAISPTKLAAINRELNKFVVEVTSDLKNYTYKKPTGGKSNITMPDLISLIIESFFSIRVLSKEVNKEYLPVNILSSGEKRKALIDLAFAFLNDKERDDDFIILGIDEPEISLHVSVCYDQFEKLKKISNQDNQVILTTHWYGFLPVMHSGMAHFTNIDEDNKVQFSSYNLENYREKIKFEKVESKGVIPFDVYLKSTNDLVQSIVSSIRSELSYKWIICEGYSEYVYFNYYFSKEIKNQNYRLLPVGGCPEISKIFEFLQVAMKDREVEIKGSVLALVDTDAQRNSFEPASGIKNLHYKRLLYISDKIELIRVNDKRVAPETEIEDCLNPIYFVEALKSFDREEINSILIDENINTEATFSYDCLDLKGSERQKIKDFFDEENIKVSFAKRYIEFANNDRNLQIKDDIIAILSS